MTNELDFPLALDFLPDGRLLVAEKYGGLHVVSQTGEISAPIQDVPVVGALDQGGLLDVSLDPEYDSNRIIYLWASLKMHFFRDSGVSSVLESSFTLRKLRFSGRYFLALTKKLLFLEVPLCYSGFERSGDKNSSVLNGVLNTSLLALENPTVIFQTPLSIFAGHFGCRMAWDAQQQF